MAIFLDKVENCHIKPCKKLKEQSGLENEKLSGKNIKKNSLTERKNCEKNYTKAILYSRTDDYLSYENNFQEQLT